MNGQKETTRTIEGWFETAKYKIEQFFEHIQFSWAQLTEFSVALIFGLLCGFAVKRYARQAIILIILFVVTLVILEYLQIIMIDWVNIKNLFGFANGKEINAQQYMQWAKDHIISVIIAVIGFVIGYKVG